MDIIPQTERFFLVSIQLVKLVLEKDDMTISVARRRKNTEDCPYQWSDSLDTKPEGKWPMHCSRCCPV